MPTDVTTAYYTSKVNKGLVLVAPAGVTFNASLFCSTKQVTAPSSSGVIIKDLSGNQNFISKDANFTYNAASYTYEIISGHPAIKRFGAVPFCTQRRNIW
jgi:hypothetical protein